MDETVSNPKQQTWGPNLAIPARNSMVNRLSNKKSIESKAKFWYNSPITLLQMLEILFSNPHFEVGSTAPRGSQIHIVKFFKK